MMVVVIEVETKYSKSAIATTSSTKMAHTLNSHKKIPGPLIKANQR